MAGENYKKRKSVGEWRDEMRSGLHERAKKKATGAKSLTEGTYEKKNPKIVKRGKKYMPEGKAVAHDVDKGIRAYIQFKTAHEKLKQGK